METIIGNSPDLVAKAKAIRHQVFALEQGISQELECDGVDEHSSHLLVTDNNKFVATARLTPQSKDEAVMARIAVVEDYRGRNIAKLAVNNMLSHAKKQNLHHVNIYAHEYLLSFYRKLGFKFIRNVEIVNGYQLIEMKLNLLTWKENS